jgi:hypothetical protein
MVVPGGGNGVLLKDADWLVGDGLSGRLLADPHVP